MDLVELIFLLFALIIFVIPYTRTFLINKPILGMILSLVLLILLVIYSYRWQMISLYILYLLSTIVFLFLTYRDNYKRFLISRKSFRQIGVIFVTVTFILNILFPLNDLTKFRGEYYVGTSTINITDYNRQNESVKMGKFRNISLRMFYPSYRSGNERQKLIDNPLAFSETMKRSYGNIISNMFSYINDIETNSYYDIEPVDDKEMPLIIISHDWMEIPEYYYDLAEKIASDGYYVAVVNYTGNAQYTTLKDSNIEFGNTKKLDRINSKNNYDKNIEKMSYELKEDFHQVLEGLMKLGEVEGSRFGQIDFKNIGVIGTSIAGSAALDSGNYLNVKAVIAYDPYIESNPAYFLKHKVEKPTLVIISEEWLDSPNTRYLVQILESSTVENKKMYYVDKFNHKDFTLLGLFTPIYRLNGTNKYRYNDALDIKYSTSKAYFDYYLKNLNTKNHMMNLIEDNEDIIKIMLR